MRMPIKLNKSYWPKAITALLPSSDDPRELLDEDISAERFSKATSVFKFGTTFKTTESLRFPATVEAIKSIDFQSPPVVLDVGTSDGITSLHVIRSINFSKYYITDLNTEVFYDNRDDRCCFYDADNHCILIVTKSLVIYSDYHDSIFPFNKIATNFFSKINHPGKTLEKIALINPEVRKTKGNIVVKKYDIFNRWTDEKVDLIIIANILNKCYFSENQIRQALGNLLNALNDSGRFVVVDSREIEKGTLFRVVNKRILAEKDINGGAEIRDLILKTRAE